MSDYQPDPQPIGCALACIIAISVLGALSLAALVIGLLIRIVREIGGI